MYNGYNSAGENNIIITQNRNSSEICLFLLILESVITKKWGVKWILSSWAYKV